MAIVMDVDMDRLAEIKQRAAQATSGPWREIAMGSDGSVILAAGQTITTSRRIGWANELSDGPFIAHSREDVDWLLAEVERYRDLLGCIWLYVDWRYVTTQLTAEQKELWADAVDEFGEPSEDGWKAERWWRDGSR